MTALSTRRAPLAACGLGFAIALLAAAVHTRMPHLAAQCGPNPIVCENQLTGNPASEWNVAGAGDSTIQGFATDISANKGDTVRFKITTTAALFNIDIYRLGYYGGMGARKIASIPNVAGVNQPACLTVPATGLVDCGNWTESATWTVPPNAVSGIYIAKLTRPDTGGASHVVFVVRDDLSTSDILLQTSDPTWQAYNQYGGWSVYLGNPIRGYKVSYNRPFATRGQTGGFGPSDWVFYAEYPMLRWLESNGYNVSYFTGVDTDRRGALIRNHKVFVSVGHDEYWSGPQRANVEAARNAGVSLMFLGGNDMFWKTRWETSIDGTGTAYRTLVCYKETLNGAVIDPADPPTWTGTWRDPRFSPPADGGRPENAVTGQLFTVNRGSSAIVVPSTFANLRFWRNTAAAQLAPGQSLTLAAQTLGYEWDEDVDNGARPAGLMRMSSTTVAVPDHLVDFGLSYVAGTPTHALTLYRHASGALVFGAGTVQWVWGLDVNHDTGPDVGASTPDINIQQAMLNLFADMGAQAATRQVNLFPATVSTDVARPSSVITSPAGGTSIAAGTTVTITGTATDGGGGVVSGVEVSADGGVTWHPAAGTASWSYSWIPGVLGTTTIMSRAVDDTGNLEQATAGVTVTVTQATCPCSIWNDSVVPWQIDENDPSAVEVGVKFRSDVNGAITGIRFYKSPSNTGTHTGQLWTSAGQLLGSVTFAGESATGWQQASFATPVAITAGVTYVASYHMPAGHYSVDSFGFGRRGVDQWPLHALADGVDGPNGVFVYGATSAFPTQTFLAENYWVDVVFATGPADTIPPAVSMTAPANGATVNGTNVTVAATASDNVGVLGVQFRLDGANLGPEVTASPYSVTWNTTTATNGSHVLTAVARDGGGNTTTSAPVTVTVNNVDTTPPTVSMTAPAGNSTVSGTSVTVSATASDNVALAGVQFLLDGGPLGAEVTASPYSIVWNTTATSNGAHTLAARARDVAGNQTTSASVAVNVLNAASGVLTIEASASGDQPTAKTTVTTGTLTTTLGNELVLAFVSADDAVAGNTVTGIAGGGLSWQLAVRTNVQRGTAEIWRALAPTPLTSVSFTATLAQAAASSLTVVTISGVDTTGTSGSGAIGATKSANAAAGAPTASLVTTRANSLVFGVGNDWDKGIARTLGGNQTLVHQYLAPVGDTFWVQRTTNAIATAGSTVTINDTAPTADRYNLSLCEVVPAPAADTTPPTVSVTAPAAGATVSGASVSVSASASDNVGVAGVQFKVDGANLGAEVTASPYTVSWNTTTAANGSHVLTATARDAAGNATTSAGVTVTVSNGPPPPTANAGPSQTVGSGATVTLSGSGTDPNTPPQPLTYSWTQPAGQGITLSSTTAASPTFTAPTLTVGQAPLVLTFTLTVNNGTASSAPSSTTVTVNPPVGAPTASAGPAQTVNSGAAVTLSGSGSDPNNPPRSLTFAWTQPAGQGIVLSSTSVASPTFTAPTLAVGASPRVLSFTLTTNNGALSSAPSSTTVTVNPPTGAPTANAGAAQSVSSGAQVTLSGSGTDPNSPPRPLTFAWTQPVGQGIVLSSTTIASPTFTAPTLTVGQAAVVLTFTLTVNNGSQASAPSSTTVTVNPPVGAPTANAGSPQTVNSGAAVTLSGSGTDPNNPPRPLTYAWTQPAGQNIALSSTTVASPTFTAPTLATGAAPVTLSFTLTVNNGTASSAPSSVTVTVNPPGTAPPPPAGSLVAAWGFNEAATATTVTDSSGNGNTGTISAATRVASQSSHGTALSFNGTTSIVTVPNSASLQLSAGMTLEAWVNPTGFSASVASTILLKQDTVTGLSYALYADDPPNPSSYLRNGGTTPAVNATARLPLNTWSHVAATYDGASYQLYVNGVLVASHAQAGAIGASFVQLTIGGNQVFNSGEHFKGLIDDVRIYKVALTQAQIQADMTTAVP